MIYMIGHFSRYLAINFCGQSRLFLSRLSAPVMKLTAKDVTAGANISPKQNICQSIGTGNSFDVVDLKLNDNYIENVYFVFAKN